MSTVAETAAAQARYWCLAGPGKPGGGPYSVGYSQPDRLNVYRDSDERGYLTRDTNADCGTIVMGAINYGLHVTYPKATWGHPVLFDLDDYWTGNLRSGLEARGYREVPWGDSDLYPQGGFQVGDVILSSKNEGGVGHVCMVTDTSYEILVAEAWTAEDNTDDGYAGDQTRTETRVVKYATHLDTARGVWTSCHRFDPARFAAQHPAVAGGTPAPQAPAPSAPQSKPGPLLGVDIANYQAGINLAAVNPDFTIVMASQGDWFTNQHFTSQVQAALNLGKPTGVYHYVDGSGVEAEVNHFLAVVGTYADKVFWAVDWESGQNDAWGDDDYLRRFVEALKARTGKRVLLYASSGVYPYAVQSATDSVRWIAQYADSGPTGWDPSPWTDGTWEATMHQYTGTGRVSGYGGDLDLNVFYGTDADLRALAGGAAPRRAAPLPQAPAAPEVLAVDGVWGSRTVARLQQVMGTPIDGVLDDDGSVCIEAFQRFLNDAVGAGHLTNLIGAPALAVDGIDGPATWKAFQFLVWAWHKEYVPGGWSWGDWIDGVDGPATVAALQRALNASTAGTGRLW